MITTSKPRPTSTTTTAAPATIPLSQRLGADAGYASQLNNVAKLQRDLDATESALRGERAKPKQSAAAALVVGGPDAAADPQDPALITELETKAADIRQAITIQKIHLASEQRAASRRICRDAAPEYQAIIRDLIDTTGKLAALFDAERSFREQLEAGGVAVDAPIHTQHVPPADVFMWVRGVVDRK